MADEPDAYFQETWKRGGMIWHHCQICGEDAESDDLTVLCTECNNEQLDAQDGADD